MKRLFAIMFSAAMLISAAIFVSCGGDDSSSGGGGDNYYQGGGNGNIILHAQYYNNIFIWESGINELDENENKMTAEYDGWYRFEIKSNSAGFLFFTDNWESKTEDLHATTGEWWYTDGTLYSHNPDSSSSSGGNNESGGNSGSGNGSSESWTSDIYLEIMAFSNVPTDFNDGKPVKLDSDSAEKFKAQLKNLYKTNTSSTTALNYAFHKALVNLSENESSLPDDLKSVNIITFTDGLDNASKLLSQTNTLENENFNTSNRDYGNWIKEQINTRTVAGHKLDCYSVGVRGSDISNTTVFQETLRNITSSDKEPHISQNFDDIAATFSEIANDLVVEHHTYNFNLKVPSDATSVRMVFDGATEPLYSGLYFDGTISQSGLNYAFSFVGGNGIELADKEVVGQVEYDDSHYPTGNIVYKLNNIHFINIADTTIILDLLSNKDKCKQFTKKDNNTKWDRNTEYDVGNNHEHNTERFSTAIYLILDATRSLGDNIDKVRDAAIDFIDALAEKAKAAASL